MLIFASSANALLANNLSFSWMGSPIDYISYTHKMPVDISFSYTVEPADSNVTSVAIDASGINSDIRYNSNYANLNAECTKINNSDYECIVRSKVLNIKTDTVNIPIKFNFEDGSSTQLNLTKTFQVDNTRPQVTFIGPESCILGKCYVSSGKPNKIKIEMQDSTASFARKRIAFKLGGQTGFVYNCSGTTCYGYVTPTCTNGQTMSVRIVSYSGSPSQDDAGNPLTGDISKNVICDSENPTIDNITISSSTGLDAITSKDNIIITVTAKESLSPTLNLSIDASSVNAGNVSGTCVKIDDTFKCTSAIKSAVNIPGKYSLGIKIEDAAGNSDAKTQSFKMLTATNDTTDLWSTSSSSVTQSNTIIQKDNLDFPRTIYAEIQLSPKKRNPILLSVKTQGASCAPVESNRTGHAGDLTDFTILSFDPQKNTIYTKFSLREKGSASGDRYGNLHELKYNCQLVLISKIGQVVYSTPELENFTIQLQLTNQNSLDGFISNEINSTLDNIQELDKSSAGWRKFANTVTPICSYFGYAQQTGTTLTSLEGLLAALQITRSVSVSLGAGADAINSVTLGPTGKTIKTLCDYATCQKTVLEGLKAPMNNLLGPTVSHIFDNAGQMVGKSDFVSTLDPYKSEWIAYATLCPDAIVYHKDIEKGIDCSYLKCLDEGVTDYGATLSSCSDQKNYATCVHDTGSTLNAIPGVSIIKDGLNFVSQTLSDPIHLLGVAAPLACKLIPMGTTLHAACNLPVTITTSLSFLKSSKALGTSRQTPADQCGPILDNMKKRTQPVGNAATEQPTIVGANKNIECYTGYCQIKGTDIRMAPAGEVDKKGEIKTGSIAIYKGNQFQYVLDSAKLTELNKIVENQALLQKDNAGKEIPSGLSQDDFKNGLNNIGGLKNIKVDTSATTSTGGIVQDVTKAQKILREYPILTKYGIYTISNGRVHYSGENALRFLSDANDVSNNYVKQMNKYADTDVYKSMVAGLVARKNYDDAVTSFSPIIENLKPAESSFSTLLNYAEKKPGEKITPEDKTKIQAALEKTSIITEENSNQLLADVMQKLSKKGATYGDVFNKKEIKNLKTLSKKTKDAIDKAQTKLDKAAKAQKSAEADIATEKTFEQYFGSWKDTFQTLFGVSNGITAIQELTGSSFASQGWKESAIGGISRWFGKIANYEQTMCESNIRQDRGVGQGTVLNEIGVGQFRSGAYISGRRSGFVNVKGVPPHYDYFIEGSVNTVHDGLTFSIVLESSKNRDLDITYNVTGSNVPDVVKNVPYTFGGQRQFIFSSPKDYSRVCLKFNHNLDEYFDVSTIKGKELCQTISSEE